MGWGQVVFPGALPPRCRRVAGGLPAGCRRIKTSIFLWKIKVFQYFSWSLVPGPGPWSVARLGPGPGLVLGQLGPGAGLVPDPAWSLVPGPGLVPGRLGPGPWPGLVRGPVWSLVPGPWSVVLLPGPWPMVLVPGPWY